MSKIVLSTFDGADTPVGTLPGFSQNDGNRWRRVGGLAQRTTYADFSSEFAPDGTNGTVVVNAANLAAYGVVTGSDGPDRWWQIHLRRSGNAFVRVGGNGKGQCYYFYQSADGTIVNLGGFNSGMGNPGAVPMIAEFKVVGRTLSASFKRISDGVEYLSHSASALTVPETETGFPTGAGTISYSTYADGAYDEVGYDDLATNATALAASMPARSSPGTAVTATAMLNGTTTGSKTFTWTATNATLGSATTTLPAQGGAGGTTTNQVTPTGKGPVSVSVTAAGLTGATAYSQALGPDLSVYYVGDSLIGQGYVPSAASAMIEALTGRKVVAVNQGHSGYTSAQLRADASGMASEVAAAAGADLVVYYAGTNDCKTAIMTSVATFRSNVKNRVDASLGAGAARVLLCLCATPVRTGTAVGWDAASVDRLEQYHVALRELASTYPGNVAVTSDLAHSILAADPTRTQDFIHVVSGVGAETVAAPIATTAAAMLGGAVGVSKVYAF